MKILIVASYNKYRYAPFVVEQVSALQKSYPSLQVDWFGIEGHGLKGYLKNLPVLKQKIIESHPDIIHAHYGLCGLVANLQRKVPVVTTYHGSDINDKKVRPFSYLSILLSAHNIFVSEKMKPKWVRKRKASVVPCGVTLEDFPYFDKVEARMQMGLEIDKKYVLFASAFDNEVKNPQLAKEAIALIPDVELLELKGYTRPQVNVLLHAVDALLMTSHSEGSPQVIKEALACECPIVSVDVGDVKEVISGVEGCRLVPDQPDSIAKAIQDIVRSGGIDGRSRIIGLGYDNNSVALKIMKIYQHESIS